MTNYSDLLLDTILTKLDIDNSARDHHKIEFLWKRTTALLKNDSLKMAKIWVALINDSAAIDGTSTKA